MKHFIFIGAFLLFFFVSFLSCDNTTNTASTKITIPTESKPIDWADALQKATSFKEETTLLTTLIQVDSTNSYQQLIANRLQTFDLRHLKEKEKLAIINLYAASLAPAKQPSSNVLQIAQAKLNAVYPTNNELVDSRIMEVLKMID